MDFELSDEQRLLVQTARRFVAEQILPLETSLDPDADSLDADDHARLTALVREMGLYGLGIPAEYGGPSVDLVTHALLAMELSQHRAGLYAPCYGVFGGTGLAQLYEATEDQKQRYLYPTLRGQKTAFFGLTEPSGGSDPARAIRTTAARDGDDWVINGGKLFISGADQADYGLVFARTDASQGRQGITCFIVDTDAPGFYVRRVVHTLRSAHYATELQFENLRVPHRNVLGEVNKGFSIAADRVSRARIPYAAACLGPAIKAQQMCIEYAKVRKTFGDVLASRQAIQWMIVDNEIDIRTARYLVLEAAFKSDRGLPFAAEAAMAKLVASEAAGRVVDRAIQIHGGNGVSKDLPLERWYRELRIRRIGEGASEIQRLIIARNVIGGAFH
ncbi:MAG TPA: acyl-CoA dehydrogenase family protein [Bryobacteraceae bacterium]|nr:acyl-CoA dehydrogenase family protein [Bryobacteraceae bacterium]